MDHLDHGKPYDPLAREDPDVTLSAEERAARSAAICERLLTLPVLREAGTILSYRAMPDEADPAALERVLPARFVYPRCLGGGVMEARQPTGPWTPRVIPSPSPTSGASVRRQRFCRSRRSLGGRPARWPPSIFW